MRKTFIIIGFLIVALFASSAHGKTESVGLGGKVSKVPVNKSFSAQVKPACMKGASANRDNALIAALDAYYPVIKKALETRRDALGAAWDIQNVQQRSVAIKDAWSAYSKAVKEARSKFTDAKKAALQTFETAKNTCKASKADDGTNSDVDNGL